MLRHWGVYPPAPRWPLGKSNPEPPVRGTKNERPLYQPTSLRSLRTIFFLTHLGVLLGRDPAANAEAAYTALVERMQRRAQRYMRIDLGFYGRE